MILNNPITLYPPPYKDKNDKIITPPPINISSLHILYIDNPYNKEYYIHIKQIPNSKIVLFKNDEYINHPNITKFVALNRLTSLFGSDIQSYLQNLFPRTLEQDPYGPGTILANMFSAIGIKSSPTCSCKRHAIEMNTKGIEWCEQNIDTICGWLKEECEKRKIPYVEMIAKSVVQRAINKAKKHKNETS
jgi:hypothetical protein